MKIKLLILLAMLGVASACRADEGEIAEAASLALKKQEDLLHDAHWRDHGKRFEKLMDLIAKRDSRRGKDEISRLNPEVLEDRIRLIALYRLQHPDLFDEIYKCYLKQPTAEEIRKRKEKAMAEAPPGLPPELEPKDNPFKEEGKGAGSQPLRPANTDIHAPTTIKESHLEAPYRFCFEYFWMAPPHEALMKRPEITLALALAQLKDKLGGADVKDLIEAKIQSGK